MVVPAPPFAGRETSKPGRHRVLAAVSITLSLALPSCEPKRFTLATHHNGTVLARVGENLAEVFEETGALRIESLSGSRYDVQENVRLIAEGRVDFAMAGGSLSTETSIRTVLPLYPEILIVLYDGGVDTPPSLRELVQGRRVYVGPKDLLHSAVMFEVLAGFGVPEGSFEPVHSPLSEIEVRAGAADVVMTFAGVGVERIRKQLQNGAKLYSLDEVSLSGHGSSVDGFVLGHPAYRSFIIPKNIFEQYPEEPTLTLALTALLVTHETMEDAVVYEIVSTILDNAHRLAERNEFLGFLSRDFDPARLSFPVHEGTLQYLHRDQPTFLERYAEVIALIFSLLLAVLGSVASVRKFFRQRKKDRVDAYYEAVMDLEQRTIDGTADREQALVELRQLKARAVRQLQDEKLQADESFAVFLDLAHSLERKLESRV